MASDAETFGEVSQALQGIRDQLALQVKVFAGAALLGVGVIGFLYTKMDAVENAVSRNTAILERIETGVSDIASDTGAIRETVQTASVEPDADAFDGFVGVKLKEAWKDSDIQAIKANRNTGEGWIFLPKGAMESDAQPVPAEAANE